MNRELAKLFREKWFLVASHVVAVLGIVAIMPDKRSEFVTFGYVVLILAASFIVLIPVLLDGGGKVERQAEQARLRARLAEEIDLQRDNIRVGDETLGRRITEVETATRKAAETAIATLAQRASSEINALKEKIAELQTRVEAQDENTKTQESVEDLTTQVQGLATTLRALVSDAEDSAAAATLAREEAAQALAAELKGIREELKKTTKHTQTCLSKIEESLESVRAETKQEIHSALALSKAQEPTNAAAAISQLGASLLVEADDELDSPQSALPKDLHLELETQVVDDEKAVEEIEADADEEAAEAEEDDLETKAVGGAEEKRSVPKDIAEYENDSELSLFFNFDRAPVPKAGSGTSLIVNLMIGIGNKPFVRGHGPGLSPHKGVPMVFLDIGRWQWVSPDPEAPVTVEVWKNDQIPMGAKIQITGGTPLEVEESHFI